MPITAIAIVEVRVTFPAAARVIPEMPAGATLGAAAVRTIRTDKVRVQPARTPLEVTKVPGKSTATKTTQTTTETATRNKVSVRPCFGLGAGLSAGPVPYHEVKPRRRRMEDIQQAEASFGSVLLIFPDLSIVVDGAATRAVHVLIDISGNGSTLTGSDAHSPR